MENELKSKDAIIEYLTKQLLSSNSKKSQMKSNKYNLNETFNGDKSFYDNESSGESNNCWMEYTRKICSRIIEYR